MNSRDRVRAAINHQHPDRVPLDFGSTAVTGIHCSVVAELRKYYGLERQLVKVHEPYQMLGWLDRDLREAMGIDTIGVPPRYTMFGFPNVNWKVWRTPWRQEVLVSEHFQVTTTPEGDILIHPQGDRQAPPSGRMPRTGYFFDAIIRQPPLDETALNPADNLEEFRFISEQDLEYYAQAVAQAETTGKAIVLTLPGTALGDIALVPATFLKYPHGIRDVEEWYVSLVTRRDYVRAVFDQQTRIALRNLERLHLAVGDAVDVVFLCGTDFGTQTSQFCSVQTYRELFLPYYRRMTDWIHQHTSWKIFKHSCGAVAPLLDAFVESGFDILNPVQCSAAGMDPNYLKQTYGSRLTFWGGGADTQTVLAFGTPEQVRQQVLERCRIFAAGGGFVFNTVHNIQARTPIQNVIAMLDALQEFNKQFAAAG